MDWTAIISGALGGSPLALVLFYLMREERKERRELQERLLTALEKQAELSDAVRMALLKAKEARE